MKNFKNVITLVRVGGNDTYVSRSFERIDDEAIATIRGCIEEDNEVSFTKEEIEECYTPSFATLKEDYAELDTDPTTDFEREGDCIWEYNDEVEIISYVLHVSIMETSENTAADYLSVIRSAEKKIAELTKEQVIGLFGKIAPSAKTIDFSDVRETYEDHLYDMGVSLYDNHGYVETGILLELSIIPDISCVFNGCETDCDETLTFTELESGSQIAIVELLEDVLKDMKSGEIVLESEGETARLVFPEEPEDETPGWKKPRFTVEDILKGAEYGEEPYIKDINDSMELDSNPVDLSYLRNTVVTRSGRKLIVDASVRAVGDVKVFFKGQWYRNASKMPKELVQCYHDGTDPSTLDPDYYVDNNNWFEEFVKITADDRIVYDDSFVVDDSSGMESMAESVADILNEEEECLALFFREDDSVRWEDPDESLAEQMSPDELKEYNEREFHISERRSATALIEDGHSQVEVLYSELFLKEA